MNSSVKSNSPAADRSRFFIVRLVRWAWGFLWSRRMLWTLAILGSLLALVYQYENWNGARELAAVRARVLAQVGTDDLMSLLPAEVPEEENFFAIPVIKSWREPNEQVAGGFLLKFPDEKLFPPGFNRPPTLEEPGIKRLDLAAWAKQRADAGNPIPPEQSPAAALAAAIGDGNGILSALAAGLSRPYSQMIPCRRADLEEAGGDPLMTRIPAASACFSTQENLAIHLHAAALTGDARKTRETAAIMMRLADGFRSEPVLVAGLVALALDNVTLPALNESLMCNGLTDADFADLQQRLALPDDIHAVDQIFTMWMLSALSAHEHIRERLRDGEVDTREFGLTSTAGRGKWLIRLYPPGWIDTTYATTLDGLLTLTGDGPGSAWIGAPVRNAAATRQINGMVVAFSLGKFRIPNPRRILAAVAWPAMSNIWETAARNLFHRRCAILTCALHRHRLAHGHYPESLAALDPAFLPGQLDDPARPGTPPGYRLTASGFELRGTGPDQSDDHGDPDKDWLWRHEPAQP